MTTVSIWLVGEGEDRCLIPPIQSLERPIPRIGEVVIIPDPPDPRSKLTDAKEHYFEVVNVEYSFLEALTIVVVSVKRLMR